MDTSDCVSLSLSPSARNSSHLKKKKIQKKIYKKTNTKKISFLGQSFLQVLMNIFLNPYKFYVFNISSPIHLTNLFKEPLDPVDSRVNHIVLVFNAPCSLMEQLPLLFYDCFFQELFQTQF